MTDFEFSQVSKQMVETGVFYSNLVIIMRSTCSFKCSWCGRVIGASTTRWHNFTHSTFQRNNNADSGFLASVKKPAFDQELRSLGASQTDDDDAVHSWKGAWERAVATACVRVRMSVSHTDGDRVELRRSKLSSDKVYSLTGSIKRGFETLSTAKMRR